MKQLGDEETDSPGRPIDALRVAWFVLCVTGLVLPRAFASPVIAIVIVAGIALLVHEKEERYPTLRWPQAIRMYRQEHRWNALWVCVVGAFGVAGLSAMRDGNRRGVFVLCLSLYYLLWLATPMSRPLSTPNNETES